jgi:hypothetical protein
MALVANNGSMEWINDDDDDDEDAFYNLPRIREETLQQCRAC